MLASSHTYLRRSSQHTHLAKKRAGDAVGCPLQARVITSNEYVVHLDRLEAEEKEKEEQKNKRKGGEKKARQESSKRKCSPHWTTSVTAQSAVRLHHQGQMQIFMSGFSVNSVNFGLTWFVWIWMMSWMDSGCVTNVV